MERARETRPDFGDRRARSHDSEARGGHEGARLSPRVRAAYEGRGRSMARARHRVPGRGTRSSLHGAFETGFPAGGLKAYAKSHSGEVNQLLGFVNGPPSGASFSQILETK